MSETIDIKMKLGDVFQIVAPANSHINNKVYYIDYIDDDIIKCIDLNDGSKTAFDLDTNGCLTDTTIVQIILLSRSPKEGYAAQHDLVAGKYIKMVFELPGLKPYTIHGKITANDEDMIEIQAGEDQVIFIDFEYKGIPKHIPLTHISIVEPLTVLEKSMLSEESKEVKEKEEEPKEEASMEFSPEGNPVVKIPPNPKMDGYDFSSSYSSAQLGEEVEFEADVEVGKAEQRYGIEVQTNDLLDELLSTIPDDARTSTVMEKIHRTIRRFKELRAAFSVFDQHGNVTGHTNFGADYKPLVKELANLNANLKWIVPVVKQTTKLYNYDNTVLADELSEYDAVLNMQNINNRYVTQYSKANSLATPFTELPDAQQIQTDLEALLDNLGNFDTNVFSSITYPAGIKKYVFQRYNLGMTKISKKIMRSGKSVYVRDAFTRNDAMKPTSVVILPKPIMEFSRVGLPGTNVLLRTALSHNWLYYYKLLRKFTKIEKYDVIPGQDVNYLSKLDDEEALSFSNKHITFNVPDGMSYEEALQSIIPRSVSLIRYMKPHYVGYNFHEMMSYFEPFFMNMNNITYSGRTKNDKSEQSAKEGGPYQELRVHIIENVKKYIVHNKEQRTKYKQLMDVKSVKEQPNVITNKIMPELLAKIMKEYKLTESMSPSELLTKMNAIDNGMFYNSILSYITAYLYTPDLANMQFTDDKSKINNSTSCMTRVIAKKYTSFKDLQKDNGNENVYFDKDYDTTPYEILKKYSASQERMSNSEFIDYFTLVLQKEYGAHDAETLARTIIAKQKPVVDGNYAVLMLKPGEDDTNSNRITYFVRKGDNWVKETSMSESELTNELLCNVENKCFFDKNKEFCESVDNAAKRMKQIAKKQMIGTTIELSMQDFKRELAKNYNFKEYAIKKTRAIKEAKAEQYSLMAHTIGTRAVINEVVVSPHASLRDSILDMVDFSKRQEFIIRFKEDYCREPVINELVNESAHWFYCKESNIKLLPVFYYTLAKAFFNGTYEESLDYICFHQGKKSDDGEAVVDKYSGYVIRYLDFSTEEEYDDQGFRMKTRSVMEQDANDMLKEALDADEQITFSKNSSDKKVFENPIHQQVHNVSKAIIEGLHLDYTELENNIMVHAVRVINNTLLNADKYAKSATKVPYDTYKNRHVFFVTACVAFIAIQSQIPSFRPKKTFPGCVYSFRGYPLEQVGDQTGITYLACMLEKMKNTVAEPWKSVSKLNSEQLQKGMVQWLDTQVLSDNKLQKLLELKRTHLLVEPDTYVPDEHNVNKWIQFQPPLVRPGIEKTVNGVGKGFEAEAASAIKSGHKSQHDHIGTMYKKMIEHTYGTYETINKVVAAEGKNAMLKAGSIIFLENSCCESESSIKCIDYFAEKDENIRKNIDFVAKYETIYNDIKSLSVAPYVTSKTAKTNIISEDNGISTRNMYEAYIHYCKLRSDVPIPDDLRTICQEKIPGLASMDINHAIEVLSDSGKKQNMNTLNNLMGKIAERNIVNIQTDDMREPEFYDAFEDSVLGQGIKKIVKEIERTSTENVFGKDSEASSTDVFELNRVLIDCNNAMLNEINTYIMRNGKISPKEQGAIKSYMDSVSTWSDNNKVHSFVYNCIKNIVMLIPDTLKNESRIKTDKLSKTMRHWDFAPKHYEIIGNNIDSHYEEINSLKKNANVCELMRDIHEDLNMKDILILLERLPSLHHLTLDTINYIYKFCYLAVYYEIILFSQDETSYNNYLEEEKDEPNYRLTEVELKDQRQELYNHTAQLIVALVKLDMKTKKSTNMNYQELIDAFRKDALQEKKAITDRFKNMQQDERNTELLLKKYKMGRWNLGEQKGIYQYDKALYEEEVATKKPENMTADELDAWEREQQEAQEEQEAYGDVGEDGDYYPEDREADEFGEDV